MQLSADELVELSLLMECFKTDLAIVGARLILKSELTSRVHEDSLSDVGKVRLIWLLAKQADLIKEE